MIAMARQFRFIALGFTACALALATPTASNAAVLSATPAAQTTPTVSLSVPALYAIQPNGMAFITGYDDQKSTTPEAPKVLQTLPFSIMGEPANRGPIFYVHETPLKGQPFEIPTSSAAFLFSTSGNISEDELPRLQITLKDAEGTSSPLTLYDGFIQSPGRWRIVCPIPSEYRGKFVTLEMVVPNAIGYNPSRFVALDPVQIIEPTNLKTGSGLMD